MGSELIGVRLQLIGDRLQLREVLPLQGQDLRNWSLTRIVDWSLTPNFGLSLPS